MAWCRLCVDDSGRDDSVRMGGKSCDYLFFDELIDMIYAGKLQDGKTMAAIMAYKLKYAK